MKTIFITSWYKDKSDIRMAELVKCVRNTIESGEIDHVILLSEHCSDKIYFPEATIVRMTHRPTFNDFMFVAKNTDFIQDGDIVIISNTDIYPEKGTRELLEAIDRDECFALSRWDVDVSGNKTLLDRWDSQDAWVFKSPLRDFQADFPLGQAGSDNALADRLDKAGYRVKNPSRTIRFNHLHLSGVINYNSNIKIDKPYLLITPHELGEKAALHYIPK